jgi:hypothetical protein
VVLAAAAAVFLWLYETWIQQIVVDPEMANDVGDANRRRRSILHVFQMELALVAGCVAGAHALLDLNWRADGVLGAAIAVSVGILSVVGCGYALSSDLTRRRYVAGER